MLILYPLESAWSFPIVPPFLPKVRHMYCQTPEPSTLYAYMKGDWTGKFAVSPQAISPSNKVCALPVINIVSPLQVTSVILNWLTSQSPGSEDALSQKVVIPT